jgi:C1q domain
MKKILFFSLFISFKIFGQSVTIVPSNVDNTEFLKIKKEGIGLDHRSANGLIGVGTYANGNGGFLQTHTNHPLRFATNNGGIQMTLSTTGRIGIGVLAPTAQLDVARGTAFDGTAIFRGSTHVSHFNYATNEDTYIRGGKNGANVYINDVVGLGFVGIGTSNPQAKLHISQGSLRVDALAGLGNIQLYADNLGTIQATLPIAFSAEVDFYPNISNSIETTVPFNIENFDESGNFDNTTNYEFNAPVNGIYHFDSSVTFGNVTSVASNPTCSMKILVNGSTRAVTTQPMVVSTFQSLNLSHNLKLNAGQKIKITVTQSSGNSVVLSGFSGACLFSGHLVTRL